MTLNEAIAKKIKAVQPTEQTRNAPGPQRLRETLRSHNYVPENDPELQKLERKLKQA